MAKLLRFPTRRRVEEETSIWLSRLDRSLAPAERAELETWLAEDPSHGRTLLRMAALWDDVDVLGELGELIALPPSRTHVTGRRRLAIAAVLLLTLASLASYVYVTRPDAPAMATNISRTDAGHGGDTDSRDDKADQSAYSTRTGERRTERLPDGSVVQINTASTLEVRYSETERRIVLVRGEAQFDVRKDSSRPFVVEASGRAIRAVGTAFNVRIRDGNTLEVAVTEGRVVVARGAGHGASVAVSTDELEYVAVDAGQIAYLAPGEPTLKDVSTEEMNARLAWQRGLLVFDGERLDSALAEVTRYTGVAFEFENEEVASIRVGGFYKADDIAGLTRSLEQNLPIEVTSMGSDRIVISAK